MTQAYYQGWVFAIARSIFAGIVEKTGKNWQKLAKTGNSLTVFAFFLLVHGQVTIIMVALCNRADHYIYILYFTTEMVAKAIKTHIYNNTD